MNIAPRRAACSTGLLLVTLSALVSPASAKGPETAYRVTPPEAVTARPSECPCFVAGGPPGGLPVLIALRATGTGEVHSGGDRVVGRLGEPAAAVQSRETSIQPSETFDWADASVGAGFMAMLGLLVAGGALVSSRLRLHRQMTAGSRR
jgi:hypothetical protein